MKLVTIDLDQKISWQEYDPEHEDYNDVGGSLEDFLSFADEIKGIPAVPLEPLCRYLEVYARTPIYNMRHTAEWWKEELEKEKWEKWTVEQDAAD